MRTVKPLWITVILALIAALPLTAFADTTLDRIKRDKVVKMGFANEAPFSYTLADGKLVGADYEVAKTVLARMGVRKMEGVLVNFGALIPGLKANRFDLIAAGLYIRPDRCEQVLFSDPDLVVGDALIVPHGNPKKIHSFADVARNPPMKISGNIGGLQAKNAMAAGVSKEQIVEFPDWTSAIAALKAGRIDAVSQTSVTARATVHNANDATIEVADPWQQFEVNGKPSINYTGFAFNPRDREFRDAFNTELMKFLGTSEHIAILKKYGMSEAQLPRGMTAAELCKKGS